MERITFGETDGDAEANCLRGCRGYTVRIDGEDFELNYVDNVGVSLTKINDYNQPVGPPVYMEWGQFDELHIY